MDKRKLIVLIFLLLIFIGFIYSIFASFSENRKYGKLSLDYFILTPIDLSNIAKFCKGSPQFLYNSADGPKPVRISLDCQMEEEKILHYLSKNQFVKKIDGSYKKDNEEIEIFQDQQNQIRKVTLLEYL